MARLMETNSRNSFISEDVDSLVAVKLRFLPVWGPVSERWIPWNLPVSRFGRSVSEGHPAGTTFWEFGLVRGARCHVSSYTGAGA